MAEQFGFGAIKVPQEERVKAVSYEQVRKAKGIKAPATLPRMFRQQRLVKYNQGPFWMCIGMAIALLSTFFRYKEFGDIIKMAPAFVYGNRVAETYTGEGMHIEKALKDFISNGICYWDDLPFIGTYSQCKAKITDALRKKAYPQHAQTAVCMFPNHVFAGAYATITAEEKQAIKEYIYTTGMPIIFIADVYNESFMNCWKRGGRVTCVDQKIDSCAGCHAMAIVGWDDDIDSFNVQNSYGDTWGDGTGDCFFPWNYNMYMDFWLVTDYIAPVVIEPKPPDPPPVDPTKPPVVIPEFKGFTWKYDAKKKKLTIHVTDKKGYDCTIKPDGKKTKSLGFSISKLVAPFTFTVYGKDKSKTVVKV